MARNIQNKFNFLLNCLCNLQFLKNIASNLRPHEKNTHTNEKSVLKSSSVLRYRAKDVICPRPHHSPPSSFSISWALPVASYYRSATEQPTTTLTGDKWSTTLTPTHTNIEHISNTRATRINVSKSWKKPIAPSTMVLVSRELRGIRQNSFPPHSSHLISFFSLFLCVTFLLFAILCLASSRLDASTETVFTDWFCRVVDLRRCMRPRDITGYS